MCTKEEVSLKFFIKVVLVSYFLLLIGCANLPNYDALMYEVKFGLLHKSDDKKYTVIETNSIPYKLGEENQFGYLITPKHKDKYIYNAVVVLPDEPQILEGKFIGSRVGSTTQGLDTGTVKVSGPGTVNMWLNPGDANGPHKVKLYINGSLADSREFLID
jgi:hypothetical protein